MGCMMCGEWGEVVNVVGSRVEVNSGGKRQITSKRNDEEGAVDVRSRMEGAERPTRNLKCSSLAQS